MVEVAEVVCRGRQGLVSHRACPRGRRKSCDFREAQSYEQIQPCSAVHWAQCHTLNEEQSERYDDNECQMNNGVGEGRECDPLSWVAFAIFLRRCPASCRIESIRASFDHAIYRILRCERTKRLEAVG